MQRHKVLILEDQEGNLASGAAELHPCTVDHSVHARYPQLKKHVDGKRGNGQMSFDSIYVNVVYHSGFSLMRVNLLVSVSNPGGF
jgi:hypothetical protein